MAGRVKKRGERATNFFNELKKLMIKHNISISHEDCHGGFELENFNEYNWKWISEATYYKLKSFGCGKQCLVDGEKRIMCGDFIDKIGGEIFLCHKCI